MAAAATAIRIALPTLVVGGEDRPELAEGLTSLQAGLAENELARPDAG